MFIKNFVAIQLMCDYRVQQAKFYYKTLVLYILHSNYFSNLYSIQSIS